MEYYFSKDRNGYYEGPIEDRDKFHPDFIKVTKSPGDEYEYNFDNNSWEKSSKRMKELWAPQQKELLKNSSWLLNTEDSPLSNNQKEELRSFRALLMTFFEGDITKKEFPDIPEFLNEWIN